MANIGLTEVVTPAKTEYSGAVNIASLPAGQVFKIEDTPNGTDYIVGTVPAGVTWRIVGTIHIYQTPV